MIVFLSFGLITTVLATDLNINFEDNGQIFQEKFNFDSLQNVEVIKVPAHGNFQKAEILNDFNTGFSARRIDSLKKCFISVLEKDEKSPSEKERSLRLANSTFGTGEFLVKKYRTLPLYEMSSEEVGQKIAMHCTGVKLIFTERFLDSDINKKAAEIIKGLGLSKKAPARWTRAIRTPVMKLFDYCDMINAYQQSIRCLSGGRFKVFCSFRTSGCTCVYDVLCTQESRFWSCKRRQVKDSLVCCTVKCE